ncbi:hypothetical protein [Paenibacillus glycanilyticus]|uniref:Uncharacterized protein n=1 Tax=Paenibacillus glycanilyticus TaxID=126569 RepID=A0ABQ6GL72_9BACL|nr:hypothetical protein [Paenibacillus glycanilyticus]GLX71250.1 hypothetical protein MU1_55990 [Paenibacillus glycanilyticus]
MKSYKVIAILAIILLMISVSMNVINHRNNQKKENYETAVDVALSNYLSHYNTGSIDRSLTRVITDRKVYFGEVGRPVNFLARDFQELSNMHRELTLMYGPLFSFKNYNQISSISTDPNIFDMLANFSSFFDYLYENNSDSIAIEDEQLYISFNKLTDEERNGIEIIAEITGELEKVRSESSQNKALMDYLEDYMLKSAEYFHTPEVQEKVAAFESIRIKLIPNMESDIG